VINDGVLECYEGENPETDLKYLTIPEGVREIDMCAFQSCQSIKTLVIPGSVKTVGLNAFEYCQKMESAVMMQGVETIEEGAFAEVCCTLPNQQLPPPLLRKFSDFFVPKTDCKQHSTMVQSA
jgi:hypothetical protein